MQAQNEKTDPQAAPSAQQKEEQPSVPSPQAPPNLQEAAKAASAKLLEKAGVTKDGAAPVPQAPTATDPKAAESVPKAAESVPAASESAPKGAESSDKAGEAPATNATPPPAVDEAVQEAVPQGITLQPPKKEVSALVNSGGFNFLMGLVILGLFIWFFAAEHARGRRLAGTILSLLVAALSLLFYKELEIKKGIELQGGIAMDIKIQPVEDRTLSPEAQQELITILQKRFNEFSTSEVVLSAQGNDGVALQMPGATPDELDKITRELKKVSKLEFYLVHPDSRQLAPMVANDAHVEIGYQALPYRLTEAEREANKKLGRRDEPLRWELVKFKPDMAGKYVKSAKARYGIEGWELGVEFKGEGAEIMGALTRENVNRQLAIVLDGEVISAPNIKEPFSSSCSITGNFSQQEAQSLAAGLENPLENPIDIAHSSYISPTLGKLTVQQGVTAGVVGLGITLMFIVFYYRFAGLVALLGLTLNIAIIFGALALFKFTLTMPGIAGIILTIGIAIDANVLIFERLREELNAGKSLKLAVETAYEKAFSSIFDANVTTLITAFVLFFLAEGTVKGFAVTLIIGIVACLFSALIATRVLFWWGVGSVIKQLSFMRLSPGKQIDYLSLRKVCLTASLVAALISLAALGYFQPLGVELRGGDKITIEDPNPNLSVESIKASLAKAGLKSQPIVQEQEPIGQANIYYVIQVLNGEADAVKAQLAKDFNVSPDRADVESVGSQVGKHMLINSAIALGVGLIAILGYVTIRYEFAFALGAILALAHDLVITAGILTLLGQEISLITVGGLLTIAGYSINDTIIIFDRLREGLATRKGRVIDVMNYSINATISRTMITSLTTLFVVVVLFLFGGPGMRSFGLTLSIGIMVGTYSSIFVAAPIVLWWAQRSGTNLRHEILDSEQSKIDPLTTA